MSWSEIKKAVNSDLSKPLNVLLDEKMDTVENLPNILKTEIDAITLIPGKTTTIFSLDNEKGGFFYGFDDFQIQTYYNGSIVGSDLVIEIDDEVILTVNITGTSEGNYRYSPSLLFSTGKAILYDGSTVRNIYTGSSVSARPNILMKGGQMPVSATGNSSAAGGLCACISSNHPYVKFKKSLRIKSIVPRTVGAEMSRKLNVYYILNE